MRVSLTRFEFALPFVVAGNTAIRWNAHVVKEIWDLATSPQMLPLTILLVPIGLYWLLSLIGIAGHGLFHSHGHVDHHVGGHHIEHGHHHAGGHGHHHGQAGHQGQHHHGNGDHSFLSDLLHGALRVVNAEEIPVMAVFSVLIIFLWGGAMLGNYWFNPGESGWGGSVIILCALLSSIILTRIVLTPLKPLFKILQNDAEPETPLIGRTGYVRTAFITEQDGQVVVENRGAPIIIGARIAHGSQPISRNSNVLVVDRDQESGLYVVRPSNELSH